MTINDEYKVFEFIIRYYLYINNCTRKGKISYSTITNCNTHLIIKSYIRVKDDKGNPLKDNPVNIMKASQNKVLPFSANIFYDDKVKKYLHLEFTCLRFKIISLEETKNHIRSLNGRNRFAI